MNADYQEEEKERAKGRADAFISSFFLLRYQQALKIAQQKKK
ncbi:hypothetical protein ACOTVD_05700 [Campylobacter jejuni]